jgi:hypothetical protein
MRYPQASTVKSVLSVPALIAGLLWTHAAPAQTPVIDDATIERNNKRFEAEAKIKTPCAMPKASEGAQLVLLRIDADALSTVTVGSQDVATRTGEIVIEAGREPLYLIVTSLGGPTIWRVSGAVERIERLVLGALRTGPNRGVPGAMPLAGATGVAADRVSFLRHPHCLAVYEPASTWVAIAPSIVQHEIERRPRRGGAFGAVSTISVPSLTIRSASGGKPGRMVVYDRKNSAMVVEGDPSDQVILKGRNDLAEELKLFTPGGVIDVDAGRVVASLPAESYAVLPQQAGLLQLMQSGALERNDDGDFLIQRKIRLPAELNGGHKLILPVGVPEPDGEPAHACIFVEETRTAMKGSRC